MIDKIEELETVFDTFYPKVPNPVNRERRIERMEMFLEYLGSPEKDFRTYHVAGSKGKGSTAAYLSSLLKGSGRKCGLYTSPHLFSVRERFTLSGIFFEDKDYIDTCNYLLEKTEAFSFPQSLGSQKPAEFEMYTVFAYLLFSRTGCTDAVIETGLGGRLDATNTIRNSAVILTPVELEHTELLGNTIAEIAAQKAGIIRSEAPVFSYCQEKEALDVFRCKAEEMNAPFYYLPSYLSDFSSEMQEDGFLVSFSLDGIPYKLRLRMATDQMAMNAALAILAAEKLSVLTEKGLEELGKTQLPGRFERRRIDNSLVVIDTAHTPHSAKSTLEAFMKIPGCERKTLIFALAEGKREDEIIKTLFPYFDRVIITHTGSFRKSDPERLFRKGKVLFPELDISVVDNPDDALNSALSVSSAILITGSFYLAGEMERLRK